MIRRCLHINNATKIKLIPVIISHGTCYGGVFDDNFVINKENIPRKTNSLGQDVKLTKDFVTVCQ